MLFHYVHVHAYHLFLYITVVMACPESECGFVIYCIFKIDVAYGESMSLISDQVLVSSVKFLKYI